MIKIHTSIAASCVRQKLSEPYFIWLFAKNSSGKGWIKISDLKKIYLSVFGGVDKTFYNHFHKGLNIFYKINQDKCYFFSVNNIIKNLDPAIKTNACFLIDAEFILLNKLKPKQILINCVLASDKNSRPLSLWYISKALNTSRSSIVRNINKSLVKITTNSRADKSDMRKFWSSYTFIGGKRLPDSKEKTVVSDLVLNNKTNIKLHKKTGLWSISAA